ncbi:MAG: hypothetical protein AAFR58_01590 [Cyanobacteria bacterium J06627_28]
MTHSASIFPLSALAVCGILLLGKPTPQNIQPSIMASSTVAASPYANSMKISTVAGTALTSEQLETASESSIFDNKNRSAPVMTGLEPTHSLLTHPIATQTARISYRVIGSWRAQDIFQNISAYPPTSAYPHTPAYPHTLRTSQCHSACFPGIT